MNGKFVALWWPVASSIVMAMISAFVTANGDGGISSGEAVQIVVQGASVFVVWASANLTSWPRMKAYVMGGMAVLNLLVTTIDGGITLTEGINLGVAFLSAAGMLVMPGPVTAQEVEPSVR
jgi:hypothetical protein